MAIKFVVEKTDTGFSAYAIEENLNAGTTGSTITELKENALEAVNLLYEHKGKKPVKIKDIVFELDLPQVFEYYNIINSKALAERIGMNYTLLTQYVNGQKVASDKQTTKIFAGLKEVAKEILELEMV